VWARKSPSEEFNGFLDAGTSLTGELSFSGTLRVEGNIHGSITTPDVLVIGKHAVVHADIKAGEVEIHGTVAGNIACDRRLQIYASGRLQGDVRSPKFIIEEGGMFEGLSYITKAAEQDQSPHEGTPTEQSQLEVT
jgi:cytoskeletal protein CcmA (bactofilin family)